MQVIKSMGPPLGIRVSTVRGEELVSSGTKWPSLAVATRWLEVLSFK